MNQSILNFKMSTLKNFCESKKLLYIFFSFYFVTGLFIYKDYGFSADEPFNRLNGLVILRYIAENFLIPFNFENLSISIPDYKTYSNSTTNLNYLYGVIFDLPLAFIEVVFKIEDIRNIYLIRHLFNFLTFFLSTVCFYHLLKFQFKKQSLALLGVILLILSPRIFAQSFYNPKDIIFLSLIIFSIYFNIKALNLNGVKFILLAAFFTALATSLRVVAVYIPIIVIFFYFLKFNKNKDEYSVLNFICIYIITFFTFLYMLWPYLWESPITNFIFTFKTFGNVPYNFYVLYLGDYINAKNLPWHYFFVWFFITTPLVFSLLIFFGFFITFRKLFQNLFSINENTDYIFWKKTEEMNVLFVLSIFFVPIFITLFLGSTIYNGWRHFYFLYPSLVFLGIFGFQFIQTNFQKSLKSLTILILFIQILSTGYFLIKSHPMQSVYFNYPSKIALKGKFSYDYWGVGNSLSLEKLLDLVDKKGKIKIGSASFTDINKSKFIMKNSLRNAFINVGSDFKNADFIFTNYYYNYPPNNIKKFTIPENFKSIIKLEVNGLLINEIFQKKK